MLSEIYTTRLDQMARDLSLVEQSSSPVDLFTKTPEGLDVLSAMLLSLEEEAMRIMGGWQFM